jgi:superfamily II DNA or RNA helicase
MFEYILKLCKVYTDAGKNILVVFTNQQPTINLFNYANEHGVKCHLIFGGTATDIRKGIKRQIETETGWILSASSGTMSMGVSINNLHGCISCMDGSSPHVILQIIGRMLRNHEDKFPITVIYDIFNNIKNFGSNFDKSNHDNRSKYYKIEEYPVYKKEKRYI